MEDGTGFFFEVLVRESEVAHGWTLPGEIYGHTVGESGGSGTVGFNPGFIRRQDSIPEVGRQQEQ